MGISKPQHPCGFSRFLGERLSFLLERIVVHWLCKLALHPHESCWTAEGGCRGRGSGSHPDTYAGKGLSLQFHCEKECVLCRFMIHPLAAAELSICRAAPCCVLSACLLSVC